MPPLIGSKCRQDKFIKTPVVRESPPPFRNEQGKGEGEATIFCPPSPSPCQGGRWIGSPPKRKRGRCGGDKTEGAARPIREGGGRGARTGVAWSVVSALALPLHRRVPLTRRRPWSRARGPAVALPRPAPAPAVRAAPPRLPAQPTTPLAIRAPAPPWALVASFHEEGHAHALGNNQDSRKTT